MSSRIINAAIIMWAFLLLSCSAPVINAEEQARTTDRKPPDYLSGDEAKSVALYHKVLPTAVTIFTEMQDIQGDGREPEKSLGSGVIISAENHVLTAAHVVQGAEAIYIKTSDGKQRRAKLLFSEASADIALLQFITLEPGRPYAAIGDSDSLSVGQRAFAIGSPYGLENSFSVGYISGFREFNRLYDGTIKAEFIQTDAAINTGNSGGPLFNSRAEVIGIASSIITQSGGFQGLSLVVTINTAKQLMALENRVWMGIEGVFLNRAMIAAIMNHDLEGGLLIERVAKDSPADKAGLKGGSFPGNLMGREFLLGGDLIIQFSTKDVCPLECLFDAKKYLSGIDKIPVTYLRGGREMTTVIDVSQIRRNYLERTDFDGP